MGVVNVEDGVCGTAVWGGYYECRRWEGGEGGAFGEELCVAAFEVFGEVGDCALEVVHLVLSLQFVDCLYRGGKRTLQVLELRTWLG